MKPIKQTKFGIEGNCFAAAIASVLEVGLEELPNLMPHNKITSDEQEAILKPWLAKKNLSYVEVRMSDEQAVEALDGVYHLIVGTSPRDKNLQHVVVGVGGKMLLDPYLDGGGVTGFKKYGLFVEINAAKEKHVFVSYDGMHEKVLCVHKTLGGECPECKKVRKDLKDRDLEFYLDVKRFKVRQP